MLQVISQKSTKQGQKKATRPSKHNSAKCGTVYFVPIQWHTAQLVSWSRKTLLLFQLTQASLFHCSKPILSPSSSGTEEQVVQQQHPTCYLCGLHKVFFTISHKSSWLGKNETVLSLPSHYLWDYNHCVICTRKCTFTLKWMAGNVDKLIPNRELEFIIVYRSRTVSLTLFFSIKPDL